MRISTTKIESFRYFIETESSSQEEFIDECKGKFVPNKNMLMGTAYHSILENPLLIAKANDIVNVDGFEFKIDDCKRGINIVDYDFPFEVKTTKEYKIGNEVITVVAKVDQLVGLKIKEHKTCWSGFNFDKYYNSLQWKFYNDIFETQATDYKVFDFGDYVSGITLKDVHEFSFPYSKLDTIKALGYLHELVNFIHIHKLESYFQPKAY